MLYLLAFHGIIAAYCLTSMFRIIFTPEIAPFANIITPKLKSSSFRDYNPMCVCASAGTSELHGVHVSTSVADSDLQRITRALDSTAYSDATLEIRPSPIREHGCFTTVPFVTGERVAVCRGGVVVSCMFKQPTACKAVTLVDDVNSHTCYCMSASECPTKFINSSARPNAMIRWDVVYMVPCIYAIRPIAADDEVTVARKFIANMIPIPIRFSARSLIAKWRDCDIAMTIAQLEKTVATYLGY